MGDLELHFFSERLKELRLSLGLTQSDFIEGLGITASALSSYEKNLKNPSINVAKRIAEKYDVSIDWLCGLSNKKNINDSVSTYSDAIRLLLQFEVFELGIDYEYIECGENNESLIEKATLSIYDDAMCTFFGDWQKMHELNRTNAVDDEVYSLWIEKTLKKYQSNIINLKK